MVKKIPLQSKKYPGHYALVDDEDAEYLLYSWQLHKTHVKCRDLFYADSKHFGLMHRVIAFVGMGIEIDDKDMIDHINGNGLDNRRCNLRVVTPRQNTQNKRSIRTSKYPGVFWHNQNKKWCSYIGINGVQRYLGIFSTEIEAFQAYKKFELTGETVICELGVEE